MWMTIEETANYLKISRDTIYKMAQKGTLPASKLGNQWRFNRQTIDRWLEANSNTASTLTPQPIDPVAVEGEVKS